MQSIEDRLISTLKIRKGKNKAVRRLCIFITIFISFLLVSCNEMPNRIPIEQLQPILVVGVDTKDDMVELTVMCITTKPGAEGGGGEEGVKIYEAEGKTIFEAKRKMHTYADKHLTWVHLQYIIIGDEAAKNGISEFLDFFMRNHENRLSDFLVVAKNSTAREFIKNTDTVNPSMDDKIKYLFDDDKMMSIAKEMSIKDYLRRYHSEGYHVLLPCLVTTEKTTDESPEKEGGSSKKDIKLDGYAIFNHNAELIEYAPIEYSRGINWIINEIRSTPIVIDTVDGARLSVEVTHSRTKVKLSRDYKTVNIDIRVNFNIPEYTGGIRLFDLNHIEIIEDKVQEIIKKEVIDTMKYLQNINSDVTGLGNIYYRQYPNEWSLIKYKWHDIFKELEVDVKVISNLRNTYNIVDPIKLR